MYAIIRTGGKQYKVSEGDILDVDRLGMEGKEVLFSDVLLFVDNGQVKVGRPNLSNITVRAEVLENFKGKKLRVSKYKAKARYRRVTGFRPQLTRLAIKEIQFLEKKAANVSKVKLNQAKSTKKK